MFIFGGSRPVTRFNRHRYRRNRQLVGIFILAAILAGLGWLDQNSFKPTDRPFYEPTVVELAATEGARKYVSP